MPTPDSDAKMANLWIILDKIPDFDKYPLEKMGKNNYFAFQDLLQNE